MVKKMKSLMNHLSLIRNFKVLYFVILLLPAIVSAETQILEIDTGGHKAMIWDVIFTNDGRYLVSASSDKTVRIWDTKTGEIIRIIRGQIGKGYEGMIFSAALSPDNQLIAVGGWFDKTTAETPCCGDIHIFSFHTGALIAVLKGHENAVYGLAFSSDSRYLISGSADNTARIWNLGKINFNGSGGNGEAVTITSSTSLEGHTDYLYAVSFSPYGNISVTGSNDYTVKLWDARSGSLITTMVGHTDKVNSAVFTPDGRYILSGGNDRTIRLWNGKDGSFIKVLSKQNSNVTSLSVSPDGTKVVTGCGEGESYTINIYSIPSGQLITSFSMHENVVLATAISPDGTTVATGGGNDNEIYLWDIKTGEVKQKMSGKGKMVWAVGFSRDGGSIAWGKTYEGNLSPMYQIYGALEQSFQLISPEGGGLTLGSELNPPFNKGGNSQGGFLRAVESVGTLSIRTEDGKIHPTLQVLKNGMVIHRITRDSTSGYSHRSFTLTPDGKIIVSGGDHGVLTSYNPRTGERLHDFIGHLGEIWGVAVSPDNRLLVSGSGDQTVRLWEIETGKLLLTIFHAADNEWVAWIPEGYYTSSVNGDRYIGWHINQGGDKAALYNPSSRFANKFYSPEIISAYLQTGGDIDEAIRIVNESKPKQKMVKVTTSDIQDIMPPVVFFQIPAERDVTVSGDSIRIKAIAKSVNKEPIKDIWILVNGKPLDKMRGVVVKGKETKEIQRLNGFIDSVVPLTEAENNISVIASNQFTQSEPEIIHVTRDRDTGGKRVGPADEGDAYKPDLYILSIGISDYKNPDYRLDVAHKDAETIIKVFNKQKGILFKDVKSRLLTNRDATRGEILDGLDWILKESTQRDMTIIFVAGHGIQDERKNYYFLPYDGETANLRSTGVKWFDFQETVTGLPSKVILMVDTCHSAGVTGKRRGVTDMTNVLRDLVGTESGVVIMTASTGKEESQERPEWGHGAFTKALIDGLDGNADFNKDRVIDIKELDLYVTNRVKDLTGGSQHPTTEIPKTMPNFPLVFQ
ncbi:MAG: caspase family protein [Nitrospinota bacterium]